MFKKSCTCASRFNDNTLLYKYKNDNGLKGKQQIQ